MATDRACTGFHSDYAAGRRTATRASAAAAPCVGSGRSIHRTQYAVEERIRMLRIDPAHHQHHAPRRLDPGEGAARADREAARRGHAGKHAAAEVEPDEVAVERSDGAWREHAPDPFR